MPSPAAPAGSIRFDLAASTLSTSAKDFLRSVSDYVTAHPGSTVHLVGHADSQGAASVNLTVSRARATAVAAYLRSLGVPAKQITIEAKGETQPVADNSTPAGRAANRRVDVTIEASS